MFSLDGYGAQIFAGAVTTVELSLLSLLGSFFLGLLGASAKLSNSRTLFGIATAYTTLIRAVPDLVLMLLIFYSLQIWLNDATDYFNLNDINLDPFTAGVITLGFIYGAYFTETFRGAFMAVPKGQMEAARAFGMKPLHAFRRILFPQMMRYALPGLANNWQVILKSTALVSLIGLTDVVKASQNAGEGTFRTFFFTSIAGLIYLFLSSVSKLVQYYLTRKFSVGVRQVVF
jgi:histidine transport system permease protein